MATTTLKMKATGKNSWDNLKLVIRQPDISYIIPFKDRYTTLEVYRQLTIAHFSDHMTSVDVDIDGKVFTLEFNVWQAALSSLDQWYEEYMMLVEEVGIG